MRITYLMDSVGGTGGSVVLFHHMEALARDNHEVRMLSPFGETQWLPGTLDGIEGSERLPGYDGIWGCVKIVQAKLRKALPGLERKTVSAFRGDALRRSVDVTLLLLSEI